MNKRVVITGMGVVAPNGVGVEDFNKSLKAGKSGIRFWEESKRLNFRCHVGGKPPVTREIIEEQLPPFIAKKITNNAVIYGCLAGLEAWRDAGLDTHPEKRDPDTGSVFGSGALSMDSYIDTKIYPIDQGEHKKLGTISIPETMASGASAFLNNTLAFGNRTMANSSACITGSEALALGFETVQSGMAKRMLCGSTEGDGRYIWSGFDAMRILCSVSNDEPEKASRPMNIKPMGFVPAGGAGALVIEDLDTALERGAKIYAEILSSHFNSGGQREGGSMTAPNSDAVQECISQCIDKSGIDIREIDLISGHLTSTKGDVIEVKNWSKTLGLPKEEFPYINTPKSMIGHCIGGAGSVELVACLLQMRDGYIHPNLNLGEIHPEISELVPAERIPTTRVDREISTVIKANFGFGDLNCVILLRKWK